MIIFLHDKVEKNVEKGDNASYPGSPFPTLFSNASITGWLKSV